MPHTQRLMVMDIKRAFLHAPIKREVYVHLPPEATEGDAEPMVGLLHNSLYGTRDASQNWQHHVSTVLARLGFRAGRANPCIFHHQTRDAMVTVHVDDFLCLGNRQTLAWLREALKEEFEYTSSVLGPAQGEAKEVKY